MTKLPKLRSGMPFDQVAIIEVLSIMVENGIITEATAIERYQKRRAEFGIRTWLQENQ